MMKWFPTTILRKAVITMFESFKDVLTVDEACAALHIGKNSIYTLLKLGALHYIKIGRKYIIPKIYLIDFINQNR